MAKKPPPVWQLQIVSGAVEPQRSRFKLVVPNQSHKRLAVMAGKRLMDARRQILVDTWGLLMVVVVTAANMAEREGAKSILVKSQTHYPRLFKILADARYDGAPLLQWVMDTYHWIWETVKRTDKAVGFVPLPQRWVVERTFGWFNWSRRLSKDYEILTDTSEAFLYIAMIRLSLRRLAQLFRHPLKRPTARYCAIASTAMSVIFLSMG